MRRIHRGVQRLIKEVAPLCFYVHCHAHRLNMVVVVVCTSIVAQTNDNKIIHARNLDYSIPEILQNLTGVAKKGSCI